MALDVKIADERDMVILALEGRVDSSTMEEFNHGLDEVKRRGKKNIILMFRDLESLDNQGAAELLSFLKWVEEENGEVKIAEVQPEIRGVLKVLGSDTMTWFSESLAEAMQGFRKPKGEAEMEKEKDLFVNDVFQRPSRPDGSRMTLIFLAAGVFLFLILLIVYMTRESSSDLQPLQKRIAFLEQKMDIPRLRFGASDPRPHVWRCLHDCGAKQVVAVHF